MDSFVQLEGLVAPLPRVNVDTDQIVPKQFLKRIEREGFGDFLFFDWRLNADGSLNPDFPLNKSAYQNASILVTGRNFGSGSSREHAVWSLKDFGFRCIISSSFADIFYNNCFQNGVLPLVLPEHNVKHIMTKTLETPGYTLKIDLAIQQVIDVDDEEIYPFEIEPFRRYCLINGLDEIALTMQHEDKISSFETIRGAYGGVLNDI
jgi:3-isopropylmalate/(R)-2-methylmalate dehydratase small subunit